MIYLKLTFETGVNPKKNLIHWFVTSAAEYISALPLLQREIKANGTIWVSWPKKSSKLVTDVTEDLIRNFAIANGLVDVKVCAVDETWSGLKLVVPLILRNSASA